MNPFRLDPPEPPELHGRIERLPFRYQRAVLHRLRRNGHPINPVLLRSIRYQHRPKSYWSVGNLRQAVANIQGAARKQLALQLIDEDRLDEAAEFVLADRLTEEQRAELGRIHPALMGGEYLPESAPGEVEIARVALQSTTYDVISLRARPVRGGIAYRVVDEYESQYRLRPRFSRQPLTLRQLIRLIDTADSWEMGDLTFGILRMNLEAGASIDDLRDFLEIDSEFYGELKRHYWFRIQDWLWKNRGRGQ